MHLLVYCMILIVALPQPRPDPPPRHIVGGEAKSIPFVQLLAIAYSGECQPAVTMCIYKCKKGQLVYGGSRLFILCGDV